MENIPIQVSVFLIKPQVGRLGETQQFLSAKTVQFCARLMQKVQEKLLLE
jgi:hypothetical protein